MPKVKKILLALQEHLNAKNYQELADFFGVNHSTLYSWVKRDSIGDTGKILGRLPYINIDWLRTGNGPMIIIEESLPVSTKMKQTGKNGTQIGRDLHADNIHQKQGNQPKLTAAETFLFETINQLSNKEEMVQKFIFEALQELQRQKLDKK